MPTASLGETPVLPTVRRRAMRQFGVYLAERGLVNAGIGGSLEMDSEADSFVVMPTHTFSGERKELRLAGLICLKLCNVTQIAVCQCWGFYHFELKDRH